MAKQTSNRRIAVFVVTLGVSVLICITALPFVIPFRCEANAAKVSWLDQRASSISYCYKPFSFANDRAYEFTMSQESFRQFAAEKKWELKPLEETKCVPRYTYFLRNDDARKEAPLEACVTNGLHYFLVWANGGGVRVLYDTNSLRAFVFTSAH